MVVSATKDDKMANVISSYNAFQHIANETDMDAPFETAGTTLSSSSGRAAARRMRRTRQRLGSYRHDLLVAMRVVNSIEREMVQSEWENWLTDETMRCDQLKMVLDSGSNIGGSSGDVGLAAAKAGDEKQKIMKDGHSGGDGGEEDERKTKLKAWYDGYCGSCRTERRALIEQGENMAGL